MIERKDRGLFNKLGSIYTGPIGLIFEYYND